MSSTGTYRGSFFCVPLVFPFQENVPDIPECDGCRRREFHAAAKVQTIERNWVLFSKPVHSVVQDALTPAQSFLDIFTFFNYPNGSSQKLIILDHLKESTFGSV